MSVFIYTSDFREKDGEVLSSLDISKNIEDMRDAANELTWKNIEDGSLDTYHLAEGKMTKYVGGHHVSLGPVVVGGSAAIPLSSLSFPASSGDGVFIVGSVNYDGIKSGSSGSNRSKVTIAASSVSPSGASYSEGLLKHTHVDNPEQYGQAGIVFAYQAKNGGEEGYVHTVSLSIDFAGAILFPSGHIEDTPLRGSLVVFVVHR